MPERKSESADEAVVIEMEGHRLYNPDDTEGNLATFACELGLRPEQVKDYEKYILKPPTDQEVEQILTHLGISPSEEGSSS